jgi:transposase-like protein
MSKKRISRSNEFKFKVALETIKGEKQISQIAEEYNVHPNQILQWKKQLLEKGSSIFSTKGDSVKDYQKEKEDLFKTVGKQQVEIDWLKKNLGITD